MHIIFEILVSTFFLLLERLSAPFGVHFEAILSSNYALFLQTSFFKKYAFPVDETILFEVREGPISVLVRNMFQSFCQARCSSF